jgi:hypothetical protein
MIFWILLGLSAAAVIITFIWWLREEGIGVAFLTAFLAALISSVVSVVLMLVLSIWFGPSYQFKGSNDHELVALQTDSSLQGRSYFLSGGYINDVRVLNYITEDGGAYQLGEAVAANSLIYQDSTDATVTINEWDMENPWFAPWSFGHTRSYEFHVPAGSILSDYTVTND